MRVYKHVGNSVSKAIRFIMISGVGQATILLVSGEGPAVTNDLFSDWLEEVVLRRDELGYVQSNLLEILVLAGITKQEVEELLK